MIKGVCVDDGILARVEERNSRSHSTDTSARVPKDDHGRSSPRLEDDSEIYER